LDGVYRLHEFVYGGQTFDKNDFNADGTIKPGSYTKFMQASAVIQQAEFAFANAQRDGWKAEWLNDNRSAQEAEFPSAMGGMTWRPMLGLINANYDYATEQHLAIAYMTPSIMNTPSHIRDEILVLWGEVDAGTLNLSTDSAEIESRLIAASTQEDVDDFVERRATQATLSAGIWGSASTFFKAYSDALLPAAWAMMNDSNHKLEIVKSGDNFLFKVQNDDDAPITVSGTSVEVDFGTTDPTIYTWNKTAGTLANTYTNELLNVSTTARYIRQ
jgi:hypothetical protein